MSLNLGIHGTGSPEEEGFVDEDEDNYDPGGTGAGVPIPEAMPVEPSFLERFSGRLNDMLSQDNPNFQEFEAVA